MKKNDTNSTLNLVPLERLTSLLGEVGVILSKVAIGSCLLEPPISYSLQIKVDCDPTRPEIKIIFNDLQKFHLWDPPYTIQLNKTQTEALTL